MKKIAVAAFLIAALVGCGGKSKPATKTPDGAPAAAPADPAATPADPAATPADPAAAPAAETPANPCAPK